MDLTMSRQASPAKAGDALLQMPKAQALAKAFVWATSNGVRECAPDTELRTLASPCDPVGALANAGHDDAFE
jgi:hypothetical protein